MNSKQNSIVEPLLTDDLSRFSLFPLRYKKVYDFYKAARASNWELEEIDLGKDVTQFQTLSEDEKHFIKTILAFFQPADGIVMENLCLNFLKTIKIPEFNLFYGFQYSIEGVHVETYSTLIT